MLRVSDNGLVHVTSPADVFPSSNSGIGLRNTVARLEQLYGSGTYFSLITGHSGGMVAELRIPYHITAVSSHAFTRARISEGDHAS